MLLRIYTIWEMNILIYIKWGLTFLNWWIIPFKIKNLQTKIYLAFFSDFEYLAPSQSYKIFIRISSEKTYCIFIHLVSLYTLTALKKKLTEGCEIRLLMTSTTTTRDLALSADGREIRCGCPIVSQPPKPETWPQKPTAKKITLQRPAFRVRRRER